MASNKRKIRNDNRTEIVDLLKMSFIWRYSDIYPQHGAHRKSNGLMWDSDCEIVCVSTAVKSAK